ncbi:MAG: glucose-6-phosphate isomerase [Abditibacteriota bacterium]|nr:glucose-6-phosphate isomerase [Abditibacteriota bacterium]
MFGNLPLALDITNLRPFVSREELTRREAAVAFCDRQLKEGVCAGSAFTGWLRPDSILGPGEADKIREKADFLRNNSDVLLVIGIGGSYLGARGVIEALSDSPERVVFAGHNISASYMAKLKKRLDGKKVALNVISKSGTTTEPAVALRIFGDLVKDRRLMVATTDRKKGALHDYAASLGLDTFAVPEDIGGRYSVLSAVGLLPAAYAGLDINALTRGASEASQAMENAPFESDPSRIYAAARHVLFLKGFDTEILSVFEPGLFYMAEWWKQLYGESEGKEGTGIFPASCTFSTDLHSMGQYIQQGRRRLLETFLMIGEGSADLAVPRSEDDTDGMNYLAGKQVDFINRMAYEATAKAHADGGVPNMTVFLEKADERSFGALIWFYEKACALSGLLSGVNPFDQPGVEAYKKYMFRLLRKPGYEPMEPDRSGRDIISL